MSNQNVNVLNSVTKTLIDSCKGYETCADMSDDSYALRAEFNRRATERRALVNEFQHQVRTYGGEPKDDGSLSGVVHRGFTKFTGLFKDDEKAAVEALDDGEEFLAEKIEGKLDHDDLAPETRTLLKRAHSSARAGERFADLLEKSM
ncbi:PA2169 family four-helix-bundle protein [Robiginitomaculum antarcticum]|uniref:PA2169 family four-helix-bundle protein n=1 Tax=Robiginitomaculum antarcticum TaxID=437507 RepID=UPI00036C4B0C|nr:PA2169 family four-helix-bundle protein [Robiginitomaculum antarcticum]